MDMNELLNENARKAIENPENWRDCSPDYPPCAICKAPILLPDVPLRMWHKTKGKTIEISFHVSCAFDHIETYSDDEDVMETDSDCFFLDCFDKCTYIDAKYHPCSRTQSNC